MKDVIMLMIFFGQSFWCFSQTKYAILKTKLVKADSVVIINYDLYEKSESVRIAIHDNNAGTIGSGVYLNEASINELIKIIVRPDVFKGNRAALGGYHPKEVILIWHNKKLSYIEVCLSCYQFYTSADFGFDSISFDSKKEGELSDFFKKVNLRYKPMKKTHFFKDLFTQNQTSSR
jgi:hypothetical protein